MHLYDENRVCAYVSRWLLAAENNIYTVFFPQLSGSDIDLKIAQNSASYLPMLLLEVTMTFFGMHTHRLHDQIATENAYLSI